MGLGLKRGRRCCLAEGEQARQLGAERLRSAPVQPARGQILPDAVEVSVVVPVRDEAGNAAALALEIAEALSGRSYEMIFVDDASRDDTRAELAALKARLPRLRLIGHRLNCGQSRAVRTGVLAARAPIVATLDGDGQNDPADLPRLVARLTRPEAPAALAMVGGRRAKRRDSLGKRIASRLANAVRKALLKDGADDSGSGVKAFKREAFLLIPYFDHMHRYMPALMLREGFAVEFLDVNHRPRGAGRSKYTNFGRLAANMTDLFGVMWLRSRARPVGGTDEL
jgi:dolichol-phosphate mannosyltransferase